MGSYFIRVDDATDLRRKILESSKASLHVLRGHQELLRIRSEKHTLIRSLRRELKELTMLVNRMEDTIPSLTKSEMNEWKQDSPPLPKKKKRRPRKKPASAPPVGRSVYVGHPDLPVLPPKPAPPKSTPPKPAPQPEVHETELDKLHSKLSDIEKKLGNL